MFAILSLCSLSLFAKRKKVEPQTPPTLDGIWEIKFGDSPDKVKQVMEGKGAVQNTENTYKNKLAFEFPKDKKVTYEDLSVSNVNFEFDAKLEKLEEIQISFNPDRRKFGKYVADDKFRPEFKKKYNLKDIGDNISGSGGSMKFYEHSCGTKVYFKRGYKESAYYIIAFVSPHVGEGAKEISISRNNDKESGVSDGFWDIRFGDGEYLVKVLLENKNFWQVGERKILKENDSFYQINYTTPYSTTVRSEKMTYGNIPVRDVSVIFDEKNEAVGFRIFFEPDKKKWNTFCDLVEFLKEKYSFELFKKTQPYNQCLRWFFISTKLCGMEIEFFYDTYYLENPSGRTMEHPFPKELMIKGKAMIQAEFLEKAKILQQQMQQQQDEYDKMKNDL